MKKFKILFYILALLIAMTTLTSCGGNNVNDVNKQSSTILPNTKEPAKTENPNFRNAKWGMTKEEVAESETAEFSSDEKSIIVYKDIIANLKASVVYTFENGELFMGFYAFENPHTNPSFYIDDYNSIKDKVSSIYGEPVIDKKERVNDLWDNEAQALEMGDITYSALWEIKDTAILLTMSSDNYQIATALAYRDINYDSIGNTEGL